MEPKFLLISRVSLLCTFLITLLPTINSVAQTQVIDKLPIVEKLVITSGVGPESLAFSSSGDGPYTGVSDGRVLKWKGKGHGWAVFAVPPGKRDGRCNGNTGGLLESICGRPLGLQFNKVTGELYIADAYHGLLAVGPEGGLATLLAAEAEGVPFHFNNGLDIDQESGMVYFTDSSTTFTRRDFLLTVLTGDATGRLLRYNPMTKELTVLLKGMIYPNGVAVSQDSTFLLVAQTTTCRILKYWLRGPRTGTLDVFAELPGYPDNIRRTAKGEFWVALSMGNIQSSSTGNAVAVRLSQEGRILQVLDGSILTSISEVDERNGTLWLGSVDMPYVDVYKI